MVCHLAQRHAASQSDHFGASQPQAHEKNAVPDIVGYKGPIRNKHWLYVCLGLEPRAFDLKPCVLLWWEDVGSPFGCQSPRVRDSF